MIEKIESQAWLETYTGNMINIIDPAQEDISVYDIAHGLSNQCRYGGQCKFRYSVAEHSLIVSQIAGWYYAKKFILDLLSVEEIMLMALLHDASETYLVDIPTPVKKNLSNYSEIETKLMNAILEKLMPPHFTIVDFHAFPYAIKFGDIMALKIEANKLMKSKGHGEGWKMFDGFNGFGFDESSIKIRGLRPKQAERLFLSKFFELYGDLKESRKYRMRYWLGKGVSLYDNFSLS